MNNKLKNVLEFLTKQQRYKKKKKKKNCSRKIQISTCTEPSGVFAHLRVQWLISQLTKILLN